MRAIRWIAVVARIEWRAILAHPTRSTLIIALVAFPLTLIVAANNVLHVAELTPLEQAQKAMGDADLRITTSLPPREWASFLPSDSKMEPISSAPLPVVFRGRRFRVTARRMALDGLAGSMVTVTRGRGPANRDEIAISAALAKELDDESIPSGSLTMLGHKYQVVGIFEFHESLQQQSVLFYSPSDVTFGTSDWLVQFKGDHTPGSISLPNSQIECTTRADASRVRSSDSPIVLLFGGMVLAEAALIIVSAFLVSLRRREKEMAMLAAIGASREQLTFAVILSAGLLAGIACIVGVLAGICFSFCLHPWLDEWTGRRNGPFEICWGTHFIAVILAASFAMGAALLPAFRRYRTLRGSLAAGPAAVTASTRWLWFGVGLLATGVACVATAPRWVSTGSRDNDQAVLAIIAGSLLGLIGYGTVCPWLVSLISVRLQRLPFAWRLAIREIGRFRIRHAPLIMAIIAGTATSVMFATIFASVDQLRAVASQKLRSDQLLVVGGGAEQAAEAIMGRLQGVRSAEVERAALYDASLMAGDELLLRRDIAIINDDLLVALGAADQNYKTSVLDDNHLFVLHDRAKQNPAPVHSIRAHQMALLPVIAGIEPRAGKIGDIGFYATQSFATEQGWQTIDGLDNDALPTYLVRLDAPVDAGTLRQAEALCGEFPATTVTASVNNGTESQFAAIYGVALLTGLVVLGVATTLATEEARMDRQILEAVGAPPNTIRSIAAARSGCLALLGCGCAFPAGALPAWGLLSTIPRLDFVFPWMAMLVTVIGLPLLAYLSTWTAFAIHEAVNSSTRYDRRVYALGLPPP